MDPAGERRRGLPFVTIFLALANIGVFVWQLTAGADFGLPSPKWMLAHGGNFGPVTLQGEQWRLFTSMFLHYGALHIVMNMIGLLDGGRHVERMFGAAGFAALYLISGLSGSLASALRGGAISAGASGAIFGVFGAFGAFLYLHRDRLDRAQVSKQSRGLLVFLAYNLFFGLTTPGIDMSAHVGGLIAGFIAGIALEVGTSEDPSSKRRSLLVAVLGVALVAGAAYLVPRPHSELAELDQIESKVLHRWQEVASQYDAGTLNDTALADVIEKELLPPWRQLRHGYETNFEGEPRRLVLEYAAAREEGWEGMARALRAGDQPAFQQAFARFKEGDAAIERMNKQR